MLSYIKAAVFAPIYFIIDQMDYISTIITYYPNRLFRNTDLRLLRSYLIQNPYLICKRYLQDFPKDQVQKVYGETYFSTLSEIVERAKLSQKDTFYDLGCGRGRSVFWFNTVVGGRAVGVEINPLFVHKARKIQKRMNLTNVEFKLANLMDLDYQDATCIYLYGSVFTDKAIYHIIDTLKSLKPGTLIISVTYPLTDYAEEGVFALEEEFTSRFLWGYTGIYIQRKL